MKQFLTIFIILTWGCSSKHDSMDKTINSFVIDTAKKSITDHISIVTFESVNNKLSDQFNIKILLKRFENIDGVSDSSIVNLLLTSKTNEFVFDTITITSLFYLRNYFLDSTNMLSYSTKVNLDKVISDNYFGDIIVADLNFDNKDDIAVINDNGGNGGAFYSYFLQTGEKSFVIDNYLTDTMIFFPTRINVKNRTLITYIHAGACCVGEHVYYFSKRDQKWIEKSHKIIGR